MAGIPANTKMWDMLVAQAKTKTTKWPNPSSSNWVHTQYTQLGGKFVESVDQLSRKERRDRAQSEKEKARRRKMGLT